MGASETDVAQYIRSVSGYVYGITGLLVLAVVIMVAAHWFVKKGTRHVVRWSAGVAWVLIVVVIANTMCYGPLYNLIRPRFEVQASVSEESAAASKDLIKEVAGEGMVLLKNDGSLPIEKNSNINVFGWASTNPIYGGTGSGSSDTSSNIDILTSLKDAGFKTNEELTNMYTSYSETRNSVSSVDVSYTDWSLPEPTKDYYTDELMENAKEFSDTAMIVLARSGGEGQDIPRDMYSVIHGTYNQAEEVANGNPNYNYFNCNYNNNGDYDDFDEGESYLHLSNTEEDMIDLVCSQFDHVVVVINANNTMELGWLEDHEQIGSVILAPGTGFSGMEALGEILNGTVNPSGKTVDTYVYDLTDTPAYNNSGSFVYTNVDDLNEEITAADEGAEGAMAFVDYVEGIYVGYKFYETAAEENLFKYEDKVQFPFGYGLSYTTFTQEIQNFKDNEETVDFDVVVTNDGDTAGKDVVEVYFTPPYENGGIEKASVNLIDFEKTDLLDPGASQTLSFSVPKEDMASYDSEGVKIAGGGYILEAGEYKISVRSDSHTVLAEESFTVSDDIDYSKEGRSSDQVIATNQFEDYSAGNVTYLSRKDGFANYEEATSTPSEDAYIMDDETRDLIYEKSYVGYDSTKYDDPADEMPTTGTDNGLKLTDMTGVDYEDAKWDDLLDQMTVEEMIALVNVGAFQTSAVESVGKMATTDSDGTSGLNDWPYGIYGTSYMTELLLAQTWNKDLAYRVGETEGQEYAECRIFGTYSPAMNIHRTAFTGRNFEYYSEDGVLSGYIASNVVNGLSTKGVYAFLKHFAMNDQETHRSAFLQTYSNEQAIREIYLKPFEISVKKFEGTALAVMSSFNYIGTKWCGSNANLLNNVLRGEWGFRGMIDSDWDGSYGYMNSDDAVRNGNDVMMGFGTSGSNDLSNTSATLVKAMRQASKNVLYTVANSGNYTVPDPQAGKMNGMTKLFLTIDITAGVLGVAILAIVFVRYRKKRAAEQKN